MTLLKDVIYGAVFVAAFAIASLLIAVFTGYLFLSGLRAFLGFAYVLFLPGYVIVRCFFDELDALERIALSFGLSIAVSVLSIMISNLLLKIPLNTLSNALVIAAAIAITLIIKAILHFVKKK